MALEIENFYGCYMLVCENPKFKGRTYIGFTVDPNRRIMQHNQGKQKGGAWRTSGRGPWVMVLLIHGFPNMISALRFEWVWQHPEKSTKLKPFVETGGLLKKRGKGSVTGYQYKVQVATVMLSTAPWSLLPLTIRWLSEKYTVPLDSGGMPTPPTHMPVTFGPVVVNSKRKKKNVVESDDYDCTQRGSSEMAVCPLCTSSVEKGCEESVQCLSPSCGCVTHMLCLADHFTTGGSTDTLVPVVGTCPSCHRECLWGDLMRSKCGVSIQGDDQDEEEPEDACWTQSLKVNQ